MWFCILLQKYELNFIFPNNSSKIAFPFRSTTPQTLPRLCSILAHGPLMDPPISKAMSSP